MAHIHSIYDTDTHFSISPITRAIKDESSKKTKVMQYDHNSERFTFEMPRYIEGHDMTLCDKVEVHYINIGNNKANMSEDVYLVTDMQISPDDEEIVIFSWLISGNATKYAGILSFLVSFKCLNNGGAVDYAWHTDIYKSIAVGEGMNLTEAAISGYSDVIAAWEAKVYAELDVKLDKKADRKSPNPDFYTVLGYTHSPEETTFKMSSGATANSIILRNGNGLFEVKDPRDSKHPTPKGYVDGLINPIEERVSDLESLTLTFTEDKATAYNKSIPAEVGKYALIKSIGGVTKKVVLSKNILNPRDIVFQGGAQDIVYNDDGSITFTIPYNSIVDAVLPKFPEKTYGMYAYSDHYDFLVTFSTENGTEYGTAGWNTFNPATQNSVYLELGNMDWNNEGEEAFPPVRVTIKVAVFEDTTEQSYEPYRAEFKNAEVSKIESIGANLITFPYDAQDGIVKGVGYTETIKGVTYTVLQNGLISAVGTATSASTFRIFRKWLPAGNYYLGCAQPNGGKEGIIVASYTNESGGENGSGYTNKAIPHNGGWFNVYLSIDSGATINAIFEPVLTKNIYVKDFKPYKAEPIDTFTIPVDAINAKVGGYGLGFIGQWDRQFYNRVFFLDNKVFYENPCVKEVYNGADSEGWEARAEKCSYHCRLSTTASDGVSAEYENITSIGSATGVYLNSTFWLIVTDLRFPTLEEFKAHLSKNPLTVLWAKKTYSATDITDLFTEDNVIEVEGGGSLRFANEHGMSVPNTVGYVTRKG